MIYDYEKSATSCIYRSSNPLINQSINYLLVQSMNKLINKSIIQSINQLLRLVIIFVRSMECRICIQTHHLLLIICFYFIWDIISWSQILSLNRFTMTYSWMKFNMWSANRSTIYMNGILCTQPDLLQIQGRFLVFT